jgi:leucyl aminopeptidase
VHAAFPFEAAFADYNRAIHSPQDTVSTLDATGAHQARFAKLGIEFLIETAKSAGDVSAQAR